MDRMSAYSHFLEGRQGNLLTDVIQGRDYDIKQTMRHQQRRPHYLASSSHHPVTDAPGPSFPIGVYHAAPHWNGIRSLQAQTALRVAPPADARASTLRVRDA